MDRARRVASLWNWLPAFRVVAEYEGIQKAAVVLHVSPSSLSRTIKLIEDVIGTPLFVRASTGLTLTAFGVELLKRTREAMRRVDDAPIRPPSPRYSPRSAAGALPLPLPDPTDTPRDPSRHGQAASRPATNRRLSTPHGTPRPLGPDPNPAPMSLLRPYPLRRTILVDSGSGPQRGRIVLPASAADHRVFVDGRAAVVSDSRVIVTCGHHEVRIGTQGRAVPIDVACGTEVSLP